MIFEFESFHSRHIGPGKTERDAMLKGVGASSLDALIDEAIPSRIRLNQPLDLPNGQSEYEFLRDLRRLAARNEVFKSYIDRKSTRLNSSHVSESRMPSSA